MRPALMSKARRPMPENHTTEAAAAGGGNPLNLHPFFVDSFSLSNARGASARRPVNPW
jgi:hypothetical protein